MEQGKMYERVNRKTGFKHKSFYHRYFQGYTEVRVKKPNGRYHIERIYTAPWKQHNLGQTQWMLLKGLYLAMALLAAVCVATSMAVDTLSNYVWFVVLPGVVTFLAAFVLCAYALSYMTKPRKMTLGEYAGAVCGIRRTALVTLVCAGITALAKMVSAVWLGAFDYGSEWKAVLPLIIAAAGAAIVYSVEKSVKYVDVPNNTSKPVNGEEIW